MPNNQKSDTVKALEELVSESGSQCELCTHPQRALLEEKRAEGVNYSTIAAALQKTGYYKSISPRSVKDKVSYHFHAHIT